MHMGIYNRLLELARAGRLTAYSDIAPLAGLSMTNDADRDKMSELLGEILRHEVAQGRPLWTRLPGVFEKTRARSGDSAGRR
jgi:hypothetical protein